MHFFFFFWNISVSVTWLVGRLELHSTKFGQSRFVTVIELKYRVWTASGVKKNLLIKIWESMACVCVCVCAWSKIIISDTTKPRHNSTNLEAEISCPYIGSKTET
jgi:hypothetical protein